MFYHNCIQYMMFYIYFFHCCFTMFCFCRIIIIFKKKCVSCQLVFKGGPHKWFETN